MVLEELKRVFFKEKDSGELYLRKWITFYRIKYPEKEGEIIKVYSHFEEGVSVLANLLKRFSPKSDSDEEEKVLFAYVYLYWLLKVTDDMECFGGEQWSSFIKLGNEELENILTGITEIILKPVVKEEKISYFFNALIKLATRLGKENSSIEMTEIEALERWYCDTYVKMRGKLRLLTEFCNKMFEYYVCITSDGDSRKKNMKNYVVNAICAEILFRINRKEEAINYAKKSLCLTNPMARQNAFLILGNSCIDAGRRYWQLAYDTYYSWLHCRMTGEELSDIKIDFRTENGWRFKNKWENALMLNNYAYLCSIIADNLMEGTEGQKFLRGYAVTLMKQAIELQENSAEFNCTYGTLLFENGEYEEAIKYYEKYYKLSLYNYKLRNLSRSRFDFIAALRMWGNSCREIIFKWFSAEERDQENCRDFLRDEKVKKAFDNYLSKLEKYKKETYDIFRGEGGENFQSEDAQTEKRECSRLEDILRLQEYLKKKKSGLQIITYIEYLLFLIDMTVEKISGQLQQCNYGALKIDLRNRQMCIASEEGECVAYYTTLNTAKYLFAELYQSDSRKAPDEEKTGNQCGEGKNCLTMMHAMYMNDPNEGLTLLQSLENDIKDSDEQNNLFDGMSSVEFREGIYDRNYIFLKAFTPRVDQLDMWAMYASDRQTGSDSNGCCICLNPETFRRAIDMKNKIDDKSISTVDLKEKDDDFHLYRVVYVGDDGKIDKGKNPGLPKKVSTYFDSLKMLVKELNECLVDFFKKKDIPKCEKEDVRKYVRGFLQSVFKIVAFLFKEDSYFLEQERRLIITRSHEQKDLIRKLNTNPPKLCINPFFQVYVDKVILGPKVKNMDEWIPYFQYELNNMLKDGFPERVVVRKSKIHYRD